MGNILCPSNCLKSISPSAAFAKPGSFMDLEEKPWGWASMGVGGSHPHENNAYKQGRLKTPLHNRIYHVKKLKHNRVSATLLCFFPLAWMRWSIPMNLCYSSDLYRAPKWCHVWVTFGFHLNQRWSGITPIRTGLPWIYTRLRQISLKISNWKRRSFSINDITTEK